jgi:hypothetical protein
MHQDTPERRIIANTAKRIVEDLMRVEAGLRHMALLDAAGNDAARKTALQNTFRRQARSLATTLTELRLANDLGCEAALQVSAPVVKYDMLTEEQQKVLKELQKDRAATTKAETAINNRPHPYSGGQQRGVITKGECRACGVMGHWARDDKCKTVDIQRKAARDAAEQLQRQYGYSSGFSGQHMQQYPNHQMQQYPGQYGYNVPAHLAPAAAGYAGPSGRMGGAQPGVVAGPSGTAGGGAALALTHTNQGPAGGAGN